MDFSDFLRVPSACSNMAGSRAQSRVSHMCTSRDRTPGHSGYAVRHAVETVTNGFTKTSKENKDRILSIKLNLDNKSMLHTPLMNGSNNENVESSKTPLFRPVSAPGNLKKKRRLLTRSARSRYIRTSTPVENEDMFQVVKAAREVKNFKEDIELFQNLEKSLKSPDADEKKDAAPVFNKRLFASQGTVIMTAEARRLMSLNSTSNQVCDLETALTKRGIQCLRCITEGLKLIHKGHDFVKDVLSRVVTYEVYKAYQYVPHKPWEDSLSCYYILNGAVEVTYDLRSRESRNVYQANILYSHGTGEYLGLVSPEGPREDLAPPATIYTKELTQLIRVDRERFHKLMENATAMIDKQKRDYIRSRSFLTKVSEKVKEKLLHKFTIQEFQPNRVLLSQGDITEYLFIIMSGRCQTYREVYIPEADREVLFYLTSRDTDDFFGEECVLDQEPSVCTLVTATVTVCLKLHRSALEMVNREKLTKFIEAERHEFITDHELRNMGYKDCIWNKFKHGQIKETLKEGGKLGYLSKVNCSKVLERPPSDDELYVENKRRFVLKGSQFEPVRVHSAVARGSKTGSLFPIRPHTVSGNLTTEVNEDEESEPDDNQKDIDNDDIDSPSKSSALMSASKAKEMEKHLDKHSRGQTSQAMDSKEALMKMLDEQSESGPHLKQAWKVGNTQETQNFMKNGVLVTMTSEDIVRKAKALADTYADKRKKKPTGNEEEEWDTILHAENKQAKMLITANKVRLKDLKRRMAELQKRRERERERRSPRKSPIHTDTDLLTTEDKTIDTLNSESKRLPSPSDLQTDLNDTMLADTDKVDEVTELMTPNEGKLNDSKEAVNKIRDESNNIDLDIDSHSALLSGGVEKLESRDSFIVDKERDIKVIRSTTVSRPDSAIGSMGSSDDVTFDSVITTGVESTLDRSNHGVGDVIKA